MIVRRRGDWLAAKVGDELVMMSAAKGNYLGLSTVGARIWELVDAPHTIDGLCTRLVAEFDVEPDVCRAEVEAFLRDLELHGAITFDPPADLS